MAQVPEKVLAWLYSVLHEYHDAQRTYSDAARTLAAQPTISPRTEVYTYENGSSALLLTLSGTLPVSFRGTVYRFPVKLWIPQAYPQETPIVYINPGRDMLVRPGQHVGVDGRVYHPYLRDWSSMWDRASIAELLEYLQAVFAKEPPVLSKEQRQQYHQRSIAHQSPQPSTSAGSTTMPPLLPPKQRVGSVQPVEMPSASTPPPRPPKPGDEYAAEPLPPRSSSRNFEGAGPPLPPLPHERPPSQQYAPGGLQQTGYAAAMGPLSQAGPPQMAGYDNGRPPGPPVPPLPQQSYQQPQQQQVRVNGGRSPVSPISPVHGYSRLPEAHYLQHSPATPQQQQQQQQRGGYAQAAPQHAPYPPQQYQPQAQFQPIPPHYAPGQQYTQTGPPPHRQASQPTRAPPPDLLSDPFDVALPGPSASGPPAPAPPIPPNPEKEHLLHALSTSLVQQAQAKTAQNLSALAPLRAQQHALQTAHQRLQTEIRQLESLSHTLDSNEAILHRSLHDCVTTIQQAKQKSQPPIDDVLLAPTMVANQLWALCAEEAGLREAMYVLQKAVDRGRVGGADFVRQMRGLGREVFGKMVLARKCARGLGLEVGGR
ncbi:hypothetical protein LTR85_001329 [Meristemomyces frigidus]|nr:hypothetical protein LTR85_001329 [Meristemomyces frigidus]